MPTTVLEFYDSRNSRKYWIRDHKGFTAYGPTQGHNPGRYAIPHINNFSGAIAGGTIETPEIPKTAIITPFGLFKFLRMPFGFRYAAQNISALCLSAYLGVCLDDVLVFAYLEDILVFSHTPEECETDLETIISR